MYVYKYAREDKLWVVGYYTPETETVRQSFVAVRDCRSSDEAAAFVNYLNGGTGDGFPWDKNNA